MPKHTDQFSIVFAAVKWYAYIFSFTYILYGGVSIVLGALDRNYEGFTKSLIFVLLGIVLLLIALAFKDRKRWGWYGLFGTHGVVMLLTLINITNPANLALFLLSGIMLSGLSIPSTRGLFFVSK